jgi:hypothetical protein
MEALQNLLTVAIEVVAIAGFGGITLHAIWSSHCNWMREYCPAIAEPVVTEPVVTEPVVTEPVVTEPVVTGPVVTEPVVTEVSKPTFEEIDNTYKAPILRQLCEEYGIAWKDIRGKGRHMLKSAMIQALLAQGAF